MVDASFEDGIKEHLQSRAAWKFEDSHTTYLVATGAGRFGVECYGKLSRASMSTQRGNMRSRRKLVAFVIV